MTALQFNRRRIEIVAAVASNGVIGRYGQIPWNIPQDLRRFRALTLGHSVVMGRKTWDSIGRALPHRENIVLSRNTNFFAQDVKIANSLANAVDSATLPEPICVIGGQDVYQEALAIASTLHITEILQPFTGDVFFPSIDVTLWIETLREKFNSSSQSGPDFHFVTYNRRELDFRNASPNNKGAY